jgi:hypothetical protein
MFYLQNKTQNRKWEKEQEKSTRKRKRISHIPLITSRPHVNRRQTIFTGLSKQPVGYACYAPLFDAACHIQHTHTHKYCCSPRVLGSTLLCCIELPVNILTDLTYHSDLDGMLSRTPWSQKTQSCSLTSQLKPEIHPSSISQSVLTELNYVDCASSWSCGKTLCSNVPPSLRSIEQYKAKAGQNIF